MARAIARRRAGARPGIAQGGADRSLTFRRGGGLARLNPRLTRLLDPAARQRGLVDGALLTDWEHVVGPELAARCQPVRIRRLAGEGVLTVRAPGPVAIELQHAAPQILERINDHFGFAAVRQLKLIQATIALPPAPPAEETPELSEAQRAAIKTLVGPIGHAGLRQALMRLGTSLASARDEEPTPNAHPFRAR